MARRRRIQTPNLVRHVMSRGNGRMPIFLDERDYTRFIGILADISESFAVPCWNFCLMPNHYHLTLRPTLPNISEAIQALNGSYALWWNRRHGRVGHVFQGRFKDQIVDTDEYARVLYRYIVLNPVRAGLAGAPDEWRWSSYAATIGQQSCPAFLALEPVLRHFGGATTDEARVRFAEFVLSDDGHAPADDRIRSNARVLGSERFRRQVEVEDSALA